MSAHDAARTPARCPVVLGIDGWPNTRHGYPTDCTEQPTITTPLGLTYCHIHAADLLAAFPSADDRRTLAAALAERRQELEGKG